MIEILVRLLPLIFFSCAVGIVILNIRSIFSYLIYVFTMASQPKRLIMTSEQIQNTQSNTTQSIFTPFIRIWTLFRVLFLPDVSISEIVHKNRDNNSDWISGYNMGKTREEGSSFIMRTYSASSIKDTSHFRTAMEPNTPVNVSSVFATTFPTIANKLKEPPKWVDRSI